MINTLRDLKVMLLYYYFIKSRGQWAEVLLLCHWKISPPLIVVKIKYHVDSFALPGSSAG